jgi:hypothetical protein
MKACRAQLAIFHRTVADIATDMVVLQAVFS